VDPAHVHRWYLSVYIDALEWVEAPNVIGMSQFADGGVVASKPYVSSGAYIDRMSDYCSGCSYRVKDRTGPRACPFNLLYWDFLMRHRDRFRGNPRMGQIYATWDRMAAGHRETVRAEAGAFLARLAVIEHGDIADAAQLERAGGGDAIHARPHHQHIQRAIAAGRQPGFRRQAEHVEVSPDGRLMRREADAGGCVHAAVQSVIAGSGCPRGARIAD
jgi:hypothetical protein